MSGKEPFTAHYIEEKHTQKKETKKHKIRVDNKKECAYNNQSLAKADSHKRQVKNTASKFLKNFEKSVDTKAWRWYYK